MEDSRSWEKAVGLLGNLSFFSYKRSDITLQECFSREYLHLLDSVEQYGCGNWEDVSLKIKKLEGTSVKRSPEEVQNEFCQRFIDSTLGAMGSLRSHIMA